MNAIAAPVTPMREAGWMPQLAARPMYPASIHAPKVPLNQLGWMGAAPAGPALISMGAPIAGAVTTSILAADTAVGAAAGPIGMAVGAVIGVIAGLWAAHDARAAGAKNENAALSSAIQAFDGSLQAIFQAANAGTLSAADAITQCESVLQLYWQHMAPYMSGPGRADNSGAGQSCGTYVPGVTTPCNSGKKCDKTCTAGCCYGCNGIWPTILYAIKVFQSGGGTLYVCTAYGDKYGLAQRDGYNLTYTPPAASASGAVSSIESALTGGSGSSMLPLLLLGLAAFLVLK